MQKKGYTLVELVITLAIVAILSGVGYLGYQSYLVSVHRADAQLSLLKLSSALENYYLAHGSYKGATLASLPFAERSPQGFYQMKIVLLNEDQTYEAQAIPLGIQQKRDLACGTLILTTDGRRLHVGNDPNASCW